MHSGFKILLKTYGGKFIYMHMYDKAYKIILKRTKEDLKSILMDYKKANWKWE